MNVRLIANAGLLITVNGIKILIDALHCRKTESYSSVPRDTLSSIITGQEDFAHVDYMLVTHAHPDHYDERIVSEFMERHPETTLLTPTDIKCGHTLMLNHKNEIHDFCNIKFTCRRLTHEGKLYSGVINYGFIAESGGESFIVLGDGALHPDEISSFVSGKKIDTAILCFPFITLLRGKKIIRDIIKPGYVIAYHLPFEKDDINNYIKTTKHTIEKDTGTMPPCSMLYRSGQSIDL